MPGREIHQNLSAKSLVYGENPSDLYFASGTSTLAGSGRFAISRSSDGLIRSHGEISFEWSDRYDWNFGDFVRIPISKGLNLKVYDSDMDKLRTAGRAHEFDMRSRWHQRYNVELPE